MQRMSNLLDYLMYKYELTEECLRQIPKVNKIMHRSSYVYRCEGHEYFAHTPNGKALKQIYDKRKKLIKKLKDLKNAINIVKQSMKQCQPLILTNNQNLTQCRRMFGDWDKLKIKPNTHPNRKVHTHNGIDFDSKTEVKIAEIYELLCIPYLHNAEIILDEFSFAADFVPLIEETGDYFIHEHCGYEMTSSYLRYTVNKFSCMSQNGLILGRDVMYTYENNDNFADKPYLISTIVGTLIGILNCAQTSGNQAMKLTRSNSIH